MPEVKTLLTVGIVAGGVLYFLMLLRAGKKHFDFLHLVETMGAGALLMGAVHLLGCSYHPENLVHVTDKTGKPLDPAEFHFHMSDLHFIEIMIASVAFIVSSGIMFMRFLPRRGTPENE